MRHFGISPKAFWGLALLVAIPAFLAFKPLAIDQAAEGVPDPVGLQMPLFLVLSVLSAIAMGIGIAILVFGGKVVQQLPEQVRGWGTTMRIGLAWIVGAWLVHEGLHIRSGHNLDNLLLIEFGFHVTTYLAGFLVAIGLVQVIRALTAPAAPAADAPAPTQADAARD